MPFVDVWLYTKAGLVAVDTRLQRVRISTGDLFVDEEAYVILFEGMPSFLTLRFTKNCSRISIFASELVTVSTCRTGLS